MAQTLLLASDSLAVLRALELAFPGEDMHVVAVADGRAAIDRIGADPPDIVLAETTLAERDGYEVAAFVNEGPHLAGIPVLLLANEFERVDEARARSVGCAGVLVKPVQPQLVTARVRELLSSRPPRDPAIASSPADPMALAGAAPGPGPAAVRGDYLDRLDAAFAAMSASSGPAARPNAAPRDAPDDLDGITPAPGLDTPRPGTLEVPLRADPPGSPLEEAGHLEAAPTPPTQHRTPPGQPSLSEAFAALLAAERAAPPAAAQPVPAFTLSDSLVDDIARRVIARLGDDQMRREVRDAAERLVQEEIDRIKGLRRHKEDAS